MAREPLPTWCFALVVVRLRRRFLLVQERKHGQGWYLPAGRVEPGETFPQAALRETLEEAGIPIVLEGILRVEHTPAGNGTARCRVVFVARPADDTPPKHVPDAESLGAAWVTLAELQRLPVRGAEVEAILRYVAGGGAIYPLSLLTREGAPFSSAWPVGSDGFGEISGGSGQERRPGAILGAPRADNRFLRLQDALAGGDWAAANEATRERLAPAAEEMEPAGRWFKTHRADLEIIDWLWETASGGRFGFEAQRRVWRAVGPGAEIDRFKRFADAVQWRMDGRWAMFAVPPFSYAYVTVPAPEQPGALPPGCLPFHNVLTEMPWATGFSPRDCWGEDVWDRWWAVLTVDDPSPSPWGAPPSR